MRKKDLVGQKFGRLTVVDLYDRKSGKIRWKCLCDCGNEVIVTSSNLRTGNTNSCGCYQREKASKDHKKHGMRKHRLYGIWVNMKSRCYNKNTNRYYTYGGRGITVCDEWLGEIGFQNFCEWSMNNGYADNLTIDREDNDKGYSPDNCRWVGNDVQKYNKTSNHYVEINGEVKAIKEWCDSGIYEADYPTVRTRIRRGMDVISAIAKPVRRYNKKT